MSAHFKIPTAKNEPVKNYAPGSAERIELKAKLAEMRAEVRDIPMYIGSREVRNESKMSIHPPHDHAHLLGHYYKSSKADIKDAIDAALNAKSKWENMPWEQRVSIFLKMAELIAGPFRAELNAATMLGQSKNAYQAEIDSACEIIDFLRYNVQYLSEIYAEQPESSAGIWNRLEWRPLEGFVYALTPFNFTAIAGNLPTSAAMCGNVVVWKPSNTQVYSAHVLMKIFKAAGLPDGVINLIYPSGPEAADVIFSHSDFAGIHFTGSTEVFQNVWKTIGNNIHTFKTYPRIVGETGGKDFVMVHKSANANEVITALSRGAFEFQGQKCSAASRAYIPSNLWEEVKAGLQRDVASFNMGPTEDFGNFINAVIDEKSFDKLASFIDKAKAEGQEIVTGGTYDKSKGYFIAPTTIRVNDPKYITMCEELFGPVLSIYVYDAEKFEETLEIVDTTSIYALTGSIISGDRYAIVLATQKLKNAAGNFYINDKPTGAVVGQQPFGGARGSGTNDKAGSKINLYKWLSPRTIKETFVPPVDYRYPFLDKE